MSEIKVYPEKSKNIVVRWVVEYIDSNNELIKESVENEKKANARKQELEELVDENGGLIDGNKRSDISSHGSKEIGSNSTTDDFVNNTRQGVSRWFSYRRFYGEGQEDSLMKTTPIAGIGSLNQSELEEVDKTAEPLGGIYKDSTSPLDFERKAKKQGYSDEEIEKRQQKLFRKTSEQEVESGNKKIPLEEDSEVNEDIITSKKSRGLINRGDKEFPLGFKVPFYSETKNKNPLVVRKLIYLINMVKKENLTPEDKAAVLYQFIKGIDASDLPEDYKNYLTKTLNGEQ